MGVTIRRKNNNTLVLKTCFSFNIFNVQTLNTCLHSYANPVSVSSRRIRSGHGTEPVSLMALNLRVIVQAPEMLGRRCIKNSFGIIAVR